MRGADAVVMAEMLQAVGTLSFCTSQRPSEGVMFVLMVEILWPVGCPDLLYVADRDGGGVRFCCVPGVIRVCLFVRPR